MKREPSSGIRLPVRYDRVCSFGHYCVTAFYLKRHYLRSSSGPFDWCAQDGGGLADYVRLVCTDFDGFLRRESLEPMVNARSSQDDLDCDYYRNRETGFMFLHDFPVGIPLDESYGEIRAKYDRRIERFYRQARSGRTLLVFQTRMSSPVPAEIVRAIGDLRGKMGDGVDLLVVEDVPDMEGLSFAEPAPGAYHVRCRYFRPEIDWRLGDSSVCDRIYGAIRCKGKFRIWARKRWLKLRAAFHLTSERRRAARKALLGEK